MPPLPQKLHHAGQPDRAQRQVSEGQVPLHALLEIVREGGQPAVPSAVAQRRHRGEDVQVRDVPEKLQEQGGLEAARPRAHGRKAVHVRHLLEGVRAEGEPAVPPEDTPQAKRYVQLRPVRPDVPLAEGAANARAKVYRWGGTDRGCECAALGTGDPRVGH